MASFTFMSCVPHPRRSPTRRHCADEFAVLRQRAKNQPRGASKITPLESDVQLSRQTLAFERSEREIYENTKSGRSNNDGCGMFVRSRAKSGCTSCSQYRRAAGLSLWLL